ncbi:hypothetical protein [Comamonas sp. JC664]|uniref:hypothetical protein n=1 Tax=Comamonas sp. JC664 TaxID=2801917 RepID=UPI00174CC74E|nr:hypothetical protein [Comamonas sp. JC664]MBL0692410.1 hypothetical protein [Comamonas sp. JC664]GHH01023.1 hypothetical protein GCM10012319_68440 [Comamonas sp. KCTC 72670]
MPPTADWTDRAAQDVATVPPDAGAPVLPCPSPAATVVVQVWCPENGQLLGGTTVQLTGPTGQQGATAVDSGAVTFRPLRGGPYSLQLTLTGAHARNYRIDAPPGPFSLADSETKSLIVPVQCVIPKAVASVKARPPPRAQAQFTSPVAEPGTSQPRAAAQATAISRPLASAQGASDSRPQASAQGASASRPLASARASSLSAAKASHSPQSQND